jgi:hypothetical protein
VTVTDTDLSPFEPEPAAEFVWMQHDEGTVPARFPIGSMAGWRALGWKPCAAPVEIDPALIERQPAADPAPTQAPAVEIDDQDAPEGVTDHG